MIDRDAKHRYMLLENGCQMRSRKAVPQITHGMVEIRWQVQCIVPLSYLTIPDMLSLDMICPRRGESALTHGDYGYFGDQQ